MKKALLIIILFTLSACSKKGADNNPDVTPTPIVNTTPTIIGKWQNAGQVAIYSKAGVEVYRQNNAAGMYYYQFDKAGNMNEYEYNTTSKTYVLNRVVKYTLSNSDKTLTFNNPDGSPRVSDLVFIDANNITLTDYRVAGPYTYGAGGIADKITYVYPHTRIP